MKRPCLTIFGCLAISAVAFAQTEEGARLLPAAADECNPLTDEIERLICQTPVLKSDAEALDSVWSIWETGINKDRINYVEQEQKAWFDARGECLSEAEPALCLQTRYEERVVLLTQPRIFQSEATIEGAAYESYAAMTPLAFVGLNLAKDINNETLTKPFVDEMQSRISAPADEECNLCMLNHQTQVDKGFDGPSLVILNEQSSEAIDDGDPVQNFQTHIYDKDKGEAIGFLDLFTPSTAPFAKNALIEAIMSELNRLNVSVTGNENGETQYFWNQTDENLQAQDDEGWNAMGLFPIVENGVIAGFNYQADSFEFAPYGSSAYFSGFNIPAAPIVAFLKPEYRANFQ